MCILGIVNEKIDKETFDRCFEKNKDGFGYAWRSKESVNFVKGLMDKKEAWEHYSSNKNVVSNHIVHFRLGSPVVKHLTHPFIISKESPPVLEYSGKAPVLFHNGSITSWRDWVIPTLLKIGKVPDEELSDTRLLSIVISILGTDIFKFISTGRFAIMYTDKIQTFGDFEKDKENLWSNDGYKKKESATYTYYQGSGWNRGNNYKDKLPFEKNYEDLDDCMEFTL
jgi:hypothetical protein